MDMTYFSLFPESIKRRKLKIPIVFIHDKFRFEVWLSGSNRNVQTKYWKLLKESDWNKYHLVSTPKDLDYVIDHILNIKTDSVAKLLARKILHLSSLFVSSLRNETGNGRSH
jgi:hypothetical protein